MWPFRKRPAYVQVWKVEFATSCAIAGGKAVFDLGDMREEFVATGPYGSAGDAAAEFVKRAGILPHGYIHRVSAVKRIPT